MTQCKQHPSVETRLFCNKCEDPICPRCLVQTPVGSRCPKCAKQKRVPTYHVSGRYLLRAIGAAAGLAVATGLLWGLIRLLPFSGFFNFIIGAGVGYAIGEGISLATNRKAGLLLAVVGGVAVVIAYCISIFTFFRLFFNPFDIIAVVIGIFVAVTRLR
ncbi:MAG TPA: B-box zinc finger protein [Dehalococcoidales bacterium]|nr:B-box zinc finger protein [Dehalococcoidales bacterium]